MENKLIADEAKKVIDLQLSDKQARYMLMYLLGALQYGKTNEKTLADKIKRACLASIRNEQ